MEDRRRVLAEFTSSIGQTESGSMMLASQLRDWVRGGGEAGTHGVTHHPMVYLKDPCGELRLSRQRLQQVLVNTGAEVSTLSWPHGKYTGELARAALDMGYRCVFTSQPVSNLAPSGVPARVLGRVEPGMSRAADEGGRFRPERLARFLFFLPKERLAIRT
jgi:hypothetical protein